MLSLVPERLTCVIYPDMQKYASVYSAVKFRGKLAAVRDIRSNTDKWQEAETKQIAMNAACIDLQFI